MAISRSTTLVALLLALSPAALAQRRTQVFQGDPNQVKLPNPDQGAAQADAQRGIAPAYSGVSLQGGEPPGSKPPPAGMQAITWPGFRPPREGQGAEVFLQLTGPVTYRQEMKRQKVLITLDKVVVPLRNNLRPIITASFGKNPVASFRLRPLKNDQVRLEITLRRKAQPTVNLTAQGKYTFLVVAFPITSSKKQ